ncbi:MAG: TonB-dependent receptor [Flavobacteriales bacterium]|nr:TonB-dependent receptor [Flavobacteriales bacterium]
MHLSRLLFVLSYVLSACGFAVAQNVLITGVVSNNAGELIPYANIFEVKSETGASTDETGRFKLSIPAGDVEITASAVGIEKTTLRFNALRDTFIIFSCIENRQLNLVEIVSDKSGSLIERVQMSSITLDAEQINKMPSLFGEADLIRTLTFLPGVSNGNEGNMGFYVRGGSADQNLILMDGVPLYNAAHILGFFSLFNPETMKSVNLIKGGFPARYGGRLASVTEITMKQGNTEKFSLEGGIGLLTAKATIQGPIYKGKTSFLVSGRSAYINLLAKPILGIMNNNKGANSIDEKISPGFSFSDVNANIQHIFNNKTRIWSTNYWGRDRIDSRVENPGLNKTGNYIFDMNWQTRIASLHLEHKFKENVIFYTSASYTDFDYRTQQANIDVFDSDGSISGAINNYFSRIKDINLKAQIQWRAGKSNLLRAGVNAIYHDYLSDANIFSTDKMPGKARPDADADRVFATELNFFAEDEISIADRIKMALGIHVGSYRLPQKWFWSVQPRAALNIIASEHWSIKASYARMMQPVHMLTNYGIGLPTDLWVPATVKFAPQLSHDMAAGLNAGYTILGSPFEFSLEGFYRLSDNVLEYKDGASFTGNQTRWEDVTEQGKGESYGMEVMVRKEGQKITGWVGYTLSWSWRKFDNINGGEKFPYRYDRRHAVNVVINIKFPKGISLTATWLYGTGNAITLPTVQYASAYPVPELAFSPLNPGTEAEDVSKRNNFRMQAYHRMDIGLNFEKAKKWGKRTWSVGIYNVYSRQNPYLYYINQNEDNTKSLQKLSLFPIIPTVSYLFTFDRIPPKSERKRKK